MPITASVKKTKVAWIRDHNVPVGQPAFGRLNCECGGAPASDLLNTKDVECACGKVYTHDGWLKEVVVPKPEPDIAVVTMGSSGRTILAALSHKGTKWMRDYFKDKVTPRLTVDIVVKELVGTVCLIAEGDGIVLSYVESGDPIRTAEAA